MSSSYQMQQLTAKLKDSDLDVRLMALTDIGRRAGDGNSLSVDDSTETALVETVLSLFNDSIAEVKSQAARTISILVAKVKEDRVQTIIERLTQMTSDKDDALRDVASLGRYLWRIWPIDPLLSHVCRSQDGGQGDFARFKARKHGLQQTRSQDPGSAQERVFGTFLCTGSHFQLLTPTRTTPLTQTSSSQDLLIQLIEVLADVYTRFDQTCAAFSSSLVHM